MKALLVLVVLGCGGAQHASVAKLDGVDIAYEIRGHGPDCVVMPGGPGLSSSYLRSKELERHVRAIYVDPIGTGGSGKLPDGQTYSMARDVATLEALRVKLGIAKWCVIGHSYGGFVALHYAIEHPAQTSGLLLYSTGPRTDDEWMKQIGENMQMFKDEPWFQTATRALELESQAKSQRDLEGALHAELPLYFAEWTRRQHEYEHVESTVHISYDVYHRRADEPYDVREQLPKIHVPAVIISGERDFLFGGVVATWLDTIPDSTRIPIPKAGHFSHVEQPAEFETAVRELVGKLH